MKSLASLTTCRGTLSSEEELAALKENVTASVAAAAADDDIDSVAETQKLYVSVSLKRFIFKSNHSICFG